MPQPPTPREISRSCTEQKPFHTNVSAHKRNIAQRMGRQGKLVPYSYKFVLISMYLLSKMCGMLKFGMLIRGKKCRLERSQQLRLPGPRNEYKASQSLARDYTSKNCQMALSIKHYRRLQSVQPGEGVNPFNTITLKEIIYGCET